MTYSRSSLDEKGEGGVESAPEVPVDDVLRQVMEAKDGPAAIAIVNQLVESGKIKPTGAAPLLRERVVKKYGASSMRFTVRVSNVWYDYSAEPKMKLAVLTWALTQDLQGSAPRDFQGRMELAEQIVDAYPVDPLNKTLEKLFTNTYYANRIANDYHFLREAIDRELVIPRTQKLSDLPKKYEPPKYEPVPYDPEKDVWLKERLERVKKRAR